MDLRDKIKDWSNETYGDMLVKRVASGRYGGAPEIDMVMRVLDAQNLNDKNMDGNSTMGLDKTEREVGKFQYVNIFNVISQVSDWCPLDMIYGTCFLAMREPMVHEKAQQWGLSDEELISKMCGRALRALPSYLREHDLKLQLEKRIPNAKFVQNQALDTKLHADLLMRKDGKDYYFWSFVDTYKSIHNFKHKFFGYRQGEVPDGHHITCPFSLSRGQDINGWKLYDGYSINGIVRMFDRPYWSSYDHIEEKENRVIAGIKL